MSSRTPRPAECHPDRPRKTKDGECDRCYARRRYEDPESRARTLETQKRSYRKNGQKRTEAGWEAQRAARRERYANDPRGAQSSALRQKFGIGLDEYDAKLAAQGGECAICKATPPDVNGRRFGVDHDHTTGAIRDILCHGCNAGIGNLGESIPRLLAAIQYLKRHSSGE